MSTITAKTATKRPNILAFNFEGNEPSNLKRLGYNVVDISTRNREVPKLPWTAAETDIAFLYMKPNIFSKGARELDDSYMSWPLTILNLLQEIYAMQKYIVFFVAKGCSRDDFVPVDPFAFFGSNVSQYMQGGPPSPPIQRRQYPFAEFDGSTINITATGAEGDLLHRLMKDFEKYDLPIFSYGAKPLEIPDNYVIPLIKDQSSMQQVLALKVPIFPREMIPNFRTPRSFEQVESPIKYGGVYVLPDFKEDTGKAMAYLVDGVFKKQHPGIFPDSPYQWLDEYKLSGIKKKEQDLEALKAEVAEKIERHEKELSEHKAESDWLLGLLYLTGDDFTYIVKKALELLSIPVVLVDEEIGKVEKKKEDYEITNPINNSPWMGEAKTSTRGAGEDFIAKCETHQERTMMEKGIERPPMLLIVNYLLSTDPAERKKDFYPTKDVRLRLQASKISALDSYDLFRLCDNFISENITKAEVYGILFSGKAVISF